jgi:very-short-patch-repair endonuclease
MTGVPLDAITSIVRRQHGVVARAQALAAGVSRGAIRGSLAAGRWQRIYPGVYATFSGPIPRLARLWAAVLAAGPGAILSHQSAAELIGLLEGPRTPARPAPARGLDESPIHLTVPHGRKVVAVPGVVVHRSRNIDEIRHPSREPPQTRVEETVLDLAETARGLEEAYGFLARAVNARLTTPDHLLHAMGRRRRMRDRRLLREGLGDIAAGCRSVLELSYLRDVERAHGLPAGERDVRVARVDRGTRRRNYLDVRYRAYRVLVELDGEAAHPYHQRFRDRNRDNAAVVAGNTPLRYGTADVAERPCAIALEVAAVLRRAGWSGEVSACGRASCAINRAG